MNLESTFYIMSIISLSLQVLLLVVMVILLIFIIKKLTGIYMQIESKLKQAEEIISHPRALAADVGEAVVNTAINEVSHVLASHKKKRK